MENKELREKLLYKPKNCYDCMTAEQREDMEKYCREYKHFLDAGKTERECVATAIYLAETHGFREYDFSEPLNPGDRIYHVNREKSIIFAVIGRDNLSRGAMIAAAHTDSPRLDLKPNPLYEDSDMAFFKTHYYGGIRKYQWVSSPLSLHGVVVLKDGSKVLVKIGEDPGDPQFVICDLLPHLGHKADTQPLGEAIAAENLNILVGGRPLSDDDGSDRIKLEVLRLLEENYGITEEDFLSAELQAVPAMNARDIGFDRSFIGAYGHDDRVCAYAGLAAIMNLKVPEKTAVCIFADKEEIGSEGVSGMQSHAFEHFMESLCKKQGADLEDCFANSFCLSADVAAAYDPTFSAAFDKNNEAKCNYGIGVCKYTGARGKSGASDASAEVVGKVRKLFSENGISWQLTEMGKVDFGGGGTVAKYMANRNIDTIDAGVPVLSMHSPYEIVAKTDCFMMYLGIKALFECE